MYSLEGQKAVRSVASKAKNIGDIKGFVLFKMFVLFLFEYDVLGLSVIRRLLERFRLVWFLLQLECRARATSLGTSRSWS